MAEKRRGLGRGLGSLIPSQETGRPSDVFFPRSERPDPDSSADAQTVEREKLPSDPAESMRRAQAGRRTGSAKRPAAKTSSDKSTTAAGSKSAATKATTAAAKTTKKTAQKSVAPSSSPSTVATDTTQVTNANAAEDNQSSVNVSKERETATEGAFGAGDQSADPATSSEASEDQSAARDAALTDPTYGERSPDGVYVSRETVRTQALSDQLSTDTTSAGAAESHKVEALPSDATSVDEQAGAPADGLKSPESDVPRETDGGADDGIEHLVPVPGTTFGEISLDRIRPNPRQPRDVFDEDALEELITSIREIGVLQPVVVRRREDAPGQYELIMGERRFRASKDAGKATIPAIVRETSNDDLLRDALLENLHRVDLNPLEEAAAYAQLLEDFNCTQEELSARIGRSRPQISNTIRLLKLPAMVQRRVAAGVLSSGHARALLGLNDGANMEVLAQRVVAEGLSVRATEEAVILLNRGDRTAVSRGTREPDPELAELARSLGDRLDTRVNVVMGKRKGKLSVEFANGEDLSRILSLLGLDGGSSEE